MRGVLAAPDTKKSRDQEVDACDSATLRPAEPPYAETAPRGHVKLNELRCNATSTGNPDVTIRPFKRAIGFVDWRTAVISSGAATRPFRQDIIAEKALRHVERIVSDCLQKSEKGVKFKVRLRLYSGWYSGKTRTDYFHGIDKVMGAYAGKIRRYHEDRVVFEGGSDGILLGDKLACVPGRLARKHGVHLLDTLRYRDGKAEEKMVDTALVVDLLGLVHRKEADRYLVISDDDDMLPGIFAAEASGAASMMLSRPGMSSKFMAHASDLIHTYRSVGT